MLVFIKIRIYTCTYSGSQVNYHIFVLKRLFVPIRCASVVKFWWFMHF